MDSVQRIAMLQQKMAELRKTYADVKAELAIVERRRKKIRRREREGKKYTKLRAKINDIIGHSPRADNRFEIGHSN